MKYLDAKKQAKADTEGQPQFGKSGPVAREAIWPAAAKKQRERNDARNKTERLGSTPEQRKAAETAKETGEQ